MQKDGRTTLINHLKNATEEISFKDDGNIIIPNISFLSLQKASRILKKKGIPLNDIDLYARFLIEGYEVYGGSKSTGIEEMRANILSRTITFIDHYPYSYTTLIALPAMDLEEMPTMKICDNISLYKLKDASRFYNYVEDKTSFGSRLSSLRNMIKNPQTDRCYLEVAYDGWAAPYDGCAFYTDMISIIKRVMSSLKVLGLVDIDINASPAASGMGMFTEEYLILSYNKGKENQKQPRTYNIPYEVARALNGMRIGRLFEPDPLMKILGNDKDIDLKVVGESNLRPITKLYNTQNGDTKRIKAALDWYAECLINKNQTYQFIFAAIALESLLGEEGQETTIGERLADRSAILLEKKESKRKAIRDDIKRLYKKRSKLVHGDDTVLSRDEIADLHKLCALVENLIRTEISNFSF